MMTEPTSAQDLFKGRHFDQEIIILCVRCVTIRCIELAEKIKKQQFNLKPLTEKATTAPEMWAVVLAA
jgi:hypothetical protein